MCEKVYTISSREEGLQVWNSVAAKCAEDGLIFAEVRSAACATALQTAIQNAESEDVWIGGRQDDYVWQWRASDNSIIDGNEVALPEGKKNKCLLYSVDDDDGTRLATPVPRACAQPAPAQPHANTHSAARPTADPTPPLRPRAPHPPGRAHPRRCAGVH